MIRKTKIVCTIGPATNNSQMISKLLDSGMDVARINMSHETQEKHLATIKLIREVSRSKNVHVGIMLDTKGPEIRTGLFENNSASFKQGDIVEIVNDDSVLGNNKKFALNCPEVFSDVKKGDFLLVDDGKVRLDIIEKNDNNSFLVKVYNHGVIKSRKGVNIPGVKLSIPFLSKKDISDIEFGTLNGVDMIASSFTRYKKDILEIKKILTKLNRPDILIIAKIENHEGVDNLRDILDVADGIMVARGDLGVEVGPALVPIYQKKMIKIANEMGKPVITATHMLESMTSNPRPTRAEASDVANAILDGSDAIMLSGETAAGEYPIVSVETMDTIAKATEDIIDYEKNLQRSIITSQSTVNDAIGIAVTQSAITLKTASCIVAFTETGGTAKRMCKFRPNIPIIAVTHNNDTANQLMHYWGVFPIIAKHYDDYIKNDDVAIAAAKSFGFKKGDTIIITSGLGQSHGRTNTMRIIDIE